MGNDESSPTTTLSPPPPPTLSSPSLAGVAKYILAGRARQILVLTGAGISTSAGIPDFRSPGTGLYANLARLNLPYAEAVFDLSYFRTNPEPFWTLARELFYPEEIYHGRDDNSTSASPPTQTTTTTTNNNHPPPQTRFRPTLTHAFLALLSQKRLLLQVITQNIDGLERAAGVPPEHLLEAHGTFATQRCIECKGAVSDAALHAFLRAGAIPRCGVCEGGLVKPDIVFFGEALPSEFFAARGEVVARADLVVVLGTSLTVYPFAGLPGLVGREVPRVLINRDVVGDFGRGREDVVVLGECDDGVRRLCEAVGWGEELEGLWRGMGGEGESVVVGGRERTVDERLEEEVRLLTQEVDRTLDLSRVLAERVRRDAAKEGLDKASLANLDHVFVGRKQGRSLSKV